MGPSLNSLVQIGIKEQVLQIFCLRDVWVAAVIAHHEVYAAYSEQKDSQSLSYQFFNFAKSSRYVPHTSTLRIPNMDLYDLHQHWYSAWIPLSCI